MPDDNKGSNDTFLGTDGKPAGNGDSNNSQPKIELGQTVLELVGEGKRYKDLESLAKGKIEADAFIEQLKREAAELREDLGKSQTLSEVLDSLKKEAQEKGHNQKPIDEETLAQIVESKLSEKEKQRTVAQNKELVDKALVKKFGDNAKVEEHIKKKSEELGMTVVELKAMANTSPSAFLRLVDVDAKQESSNAVPAGADHSAEALLSQKPSGIVPGSYNYYKELRKNDPKKYYSPAVQNEMFENRKKMGEAFYK